VTREPEKHSAGSQRLSALVSNHGDVEALAEKLGVAGYVVSKWLHGKRKPTAGMREVIQDKLGIDWRLWEQPPRKNGRAA
jgi:transcriptional regulator with XRE-family HTH domain